MIPVALTAVTGFFLFDPVFSGKLFTVVAGVLLLAIAASVLNQIQERNLDSLMNRTRHRPLADKSLTLTSAWIILSITFATGSLLLFTSGGFNAFITGIFTLAWYNGVYTNLKRITAFAVVPGALTGALPPLIGYFGAGGLLNNPGIVALCFVLFMAQIPHFWMIQIRYGVEYKNAGFPSLISLFNITALERLTFTWVLASLTSTLLLPVFGIITESFFLYTLMGITGFTFVMFLNYLIKWIKVKEKVYFIAFNLYYLIVMGLVVAERL